MILCRSSKFFFRSRYKILIDDSAQTCGTIFKIERGVFRVLDQSGQVKSLRPNMLQGKVPVLTSLATDAEGSTVQTGDTMKEMAGSVCRLLANTCH